MSVRVLTTLETYVSSPPPFHDANAQFSSPPLQMFEKFSITDVDSSGRGGEYTVQAGFGWTNGVVLWVASIFGEQLVAPACPDPLFAAGG